MLFVLEEPTELTLSISVQSNLDSAASGIENVSLKTSQTTSTNDMKIMNHCVLLEGITKQIIVIVYIINAPVNRVLSSFMLPHTLVLCKYNEHTITALLYIFSHWIPCRMRMFGLAIHFQAAPFR